MNRSCFRVPFTIMFASDNWEWAAGEDCMQMDIAQVGFKLRYEVCNMIVS